MTRNFVNLLMLIMIFSAIFARADATPNLLNNGDFENIDTARKIVHGGKNGPLVGWTPYFFPAQGGAAGIAVPAFMGKNAVFLESTAASKTLMWESDALPVEPGQKFKLYFAIAIENLQAGSGWNKPGVMAVFYDQNDQRVTHRDLYRFGDNTPWKEYSQEFTVPPDRKNIAKMRIGLVISFCLGKVFFDNVFLTTAAEKKAQPVAQLTTDECRAIVFPNPKKMTLGDGQIKLSDLRLNASALPQTPTCKYLISSCIKKIAPGNGGIPMTLSVDMTLNSNPEYYRLKISYSGVELRGVSERGLVCGLQTLWQLNKNGILPEVIIEDWPDFQTRGIILGMISPEKLDVQLLYKFNFVWLCGGEYVGREWARDLTSDEKQHITALEKAANIRQMRMVRGVRPGFGKIEIHFSDPKHIEAVCRKYRDYYDCGVREFYLAYDDLFNIGRDKLSFRDDIDTFKTIAEAHYYLANQVYITLKKLNAENKLYLVPMYYFDPTFYSSSEKDYLRSLSRLPKEVEFINTTTLEDAGINNAEKITGRQPFLWSNYLSQFENISPRPEIIGQMSMKYSDNIVSKLTGFMFVIWPEHRMMQELFSDFMWNANHYNPEKSFSRALAGRPDAGINNIIAEYMQFQKNFGRYQFVGLSKQEILAMAPGIFDTIDSWERRIKAMPAAEQKKIACSLSEHRRNYQSLVNFLKAGEYPMVLNLSNGDFSSLPVVCSKFVKPVKLWTNNEPVYPMAQTQVQAGYNNEHLYLRFICNEPGTENRRSRLNGHDEMIYTDDCVEIFLMPPGASSYYHLAINPNGALFDSYCSEPEDKTWESGAAVKVQNTSASWTVDCQIPWKAFGTAGDLKGQTWKVNFFRAKYSGEQEFSSAFPVVNRFHEKERFWNMFLSGENK